MKLRTLDKAILEIKAEDPGTELTRTALRRMMLTGQVKTVMVGRKRLVDLDELKGQICEIATNPGKIRRVEVR